MKKAIVLKPLAPPLNQLHMELRVNAKLSFDPSLYAYHPDDSLRGEVEGTLIGKTVEDLLDAANEERLIVINGEAGLDEALGIYDRPNFEVNDELYDPQMNDEYHSLFWEHVLCDESGTVWSEIKVIEGDDKSHLESLESGWVHEDGTPCQEYLAPVEPTRSFWCTTHQQSVHH